MKTYADVAAEAKAALILANDQKGQHEVPIRSYNGSTANSNPEKALDKNLLGKDDGTTLFGFETEQAEPIVLKM